MGRKWPILFFIAVIIICLGLSTSLMVAESVAAESVAAEFDWKKHQGTHIKILLNKHPYTDALIYHLNEFVMKTGIQVSFDTVLEDKYFDKVTATLLKKSPEYSVFMTGAYQIWQYAPQGHMEDLNPYIKDLRKTSIDWDVGDFFENIFSSLAWNLKPGFPLGTADAGQWAVPLGFETNTLIYRKDIFAKHDFVPPKDLPELVALCARLEKLEPTMIPIVTRGSRSWATIHPGFLSSFTGYGAKDYDPFPEPGMNSPKAVEMTQMWVDMLRDYGPKQWTSYLWYDVSKALGRGQAVMAYDADIIGYFQNQIGSSSVAGKLAWAPGPGAPGAEYTPNMWIWSMAMNAHSKTKDAAWYFLQWATSKELQLKGVRGRFSLVDPVRKSIWADPQFQIKLSAFADYSKTFHQIIPNCKIYFTPQPLFFETTTQWAGALQEIYHGKDAKVALDELVSKLKQRLKKGLDNDNKK
ncbi:MAG: extracellular solute-binding protein [Desulfobacteraceae bacterium]|nr:extracellular solute-binding protein [Desulfobacteraceae bacterium]